MNSSTIGYEKIFQDIEKELEEIRVRQLHPLLIHRHIFRQFAEATSPYVGLYVGGAASGWIGRNYIAYAATSVRRMVEHSKTPQKRKKIVSLVNFLLEARQYTSLITRQRLRQKNLDTFPDWARAQAIEDADKVFDYGVGQGALNGLTNDIIQRDIDSLKNSSKHVITIANNWITHNSKVSRVKDGIFE